MAAPQRLVVRTYAPLRRLLLLGGAIGLAGLALFIAFEWGRGNAGFDGRAARIARSDLLDRVARLSSDLAFYRGVAGDKNPDEALKIQQFRVSRGKSAGEYLLRLVLARPL